MKSNPRLVQRRCLRASNNNLKKGHVLARIVILLHCDQSLKEVLSLIDKANLIGKELLMDIDAGEHLTKKNSQVMIKGQKVGLRAVEKEDLPFLRDWRNIPDFRKQFSRG